MAKSGGGATSSNVKPTTARGGGKPAQAKNPGGVAQFGLAQGDHTMQGPTNYRCDPRNLPVSGGLLSTPMGNDLTHGTGPKGQGRTVMGCGSQQGVSPPTPIGPTKDTLSEYGPDYQNSRTRR
jgi:hypothetical protein